MSYRTEEGISVCRWGQGLSEGSWNKGAGVWGGSLRGLELEPGGDGTDIHSDRWKFPPLSFASAAQKMREGGRGREGE